MMEQAVFCEKFLATLNDQQREAVQAVDGPTLLLAVPGSGKTTVLVTRLGYMIHCCGIAPENILTLTYTVAATKEMSQRFARNFGSEYAERMRFWTINGLSARIIQYYSRYHGKGTAFRLLSNDGDVSRIVSSIYQTIVQQYPTETTIKSLRTAITYAKNMMFSEQDIEKMEVGVNQFPQIFRVYQNYMLQQRLMDFDDQMVYADRILRTIPAVLAHFQEQFEYICVDESQDTSKIQHAIIELLARKNQNIFMVGDEDQSIYGFRAAYPEALTGFGKTYPNAKVLLMEKNYRSVQEIVDVANAFVKRNRFRYEKNIQAACGNGSQVQVLNVANRTAQFAHLLDIAKNCTEETAVLYRNNESAIPLIDILDRQGLPFNIRAADAVFFTHRVVADICDIIRFAYDPMDCDAFKRIYYKFGCGVSKVDAIRACERSQKSGKPILGELLSGNMSRFAQIKLCKIAEILNRIPKAKSAEDALSEIWNKIGYKEYVTKNHLDPFKYEILRIIAKGESNGQGLLRRLNELSEIVRNHPYDSNAQFFLSTIHSSKGLEYEKVYLLDVIDEIFPSVTPANETDIENVRLYEEERRLFYVGMTRAKNELHLFRIKNTEQSFVEEVQYAVRKEAYPPATSKSRRSSSSPTPASHLPSSGNSSENIVRGLTRNESGKSPVDTSGFVPGAAVMHGRFGAGEIRAIDGNKIVIVFTDKGQVKSFDLQTSLKKGFIKLQ